MKHDVKFTAEELRLLNKYPNYSSKQALASVNKFAAMFAETDEVFYRAMKDRQLTLWNTFRKAGR